MAGTAQVIQEMNRLPGVRYSVLVPNMKGLDILLDLLSTPMPNAQPLTNEIAIFTSASDGFNKANTNATIAESLDRLAPVVQRYVRFGHLACLWAVISHRVRQSIGE